MGAVSKKKVEAFMVIEGWADQEIFAAFLGKLAQALEKEGRLANSLLVFDNARIHKTELVYSKILKFISYAFLPPYSPQLSPI